MIDPKRYEKGGIPLPPADRHDPEAAIDTTTIGRARGGWKQAVGAAGAVEPVSTVLASRGR